MPETSAKPNLPKGRYRHYKGPEYEVIDLVRHSETDEWHVLYYPHYDKDKALWVRPYTMFIESVEKEGKTVARFEYIGD
jgi:hypothetical protein